MEICNTKSSSSHKNLSFIGLLDCYQISHLPILLYAENCCTIVDKFHSKTEVSLIQFSWKFAQPLYYKCRSCIPNFKPIQIDLVILLWLSSQLTQIFNKGQILSSWAILYQIESNLMSTYLNNSQDIYLIISHIEYHLMIISIQTNSILITNHLIHSIILDSFSILADYPRTLGWPSAHCSVDNPSVYPKLAGWTDDKRTVRGLLADRPQCNFAA